MCDKFNKLGKLEFNLEDPYATEDFRLALKANDLNLCLDEIWNRIFRPAFKHGYPDKIIEDLIEKCGSYTDENGYEASYGLDLIDALSELYKEIKEEYDV